MTDIKEALDRIRQGTATAKDADAIEAYIARADVRVQCVQAVVAEVESLLDGLSERLTTLAQQLESV